jgi:hypothetical protein
MRFNNRTAVTFSIEPRALSEYSRFTFSKMQAKAEARILEYIFGDKNDLVTGGSGSPNPVLDLSNPNNCKVYREDGRINKIETTIVYNIDIDEVSGEILLDVNNGSLQGYKKQFSVRA